MKIPTLAWIVLALAPAAFGGNLPMGAGVQISVSSDVGHPLMNELDSPLSMSSAGHSSNALTQAVSVEPPQLSQFLFLLLFLLVLIAAVELGVRAQAGRRPGPDPQAEPDGANTPDRARAGLS